MTQLSSALDHYSWLLVGLCGGWDGSSSGGSTAPITPPKSLLRDAGPLFSAVQAFLILFSPQQAKAVDGANARRTMSAAHRTENPGWRFLVQQAAGSPTLTAP